MKTAMIETGDNVLISPDLTGMANWMESIAIHVCNIFEMTVKHYKSILK